MNKIFAVICTLFLISCASSQDIYNEYQLMTQEIRRADMECVKITPLELNQCSRQKAIDFAERIKVSDITPYQEYFDDRQPVFDRFKANQATVPEVMSEIERANSILSSKTLKNMRAASRRRDAANALSAGMKDFGDSMQQRENYSRSTSCLATRGSSSHVWINCY